MDLRSDRKTDERANEEALGSLRARLAHEEPVVAFVGSGLSSEKPLSLPLWSDLVRELVELARRDKAVPERDEALLSEGSILDVCSRLEELLGPARLRSHLADCFRIPSGQCCPVHELLWNLPLQGILTTNFDQALENSYAREHRKPLTLYYGQPEGDHLLLGMARSARRSDRDLVLAHLHGAVDMSPLVFTNADYDRLYSRNNYVEALKTIFTATTVVFLGCSVELEIRLMLKRIRRTFPGDKRFLHYAILPYSEWQSPLIQRRELEDDRINAIFYPVDDREPRHRWLHELLRDSTPKGVLARVKREVADVDRELAEAKKAIEGLAELGQRSSRRRRAAKALDELAKHIYELRRAYSRDDLARDAQTIMSRWSSEQLGETPDDDERALWSIRKELLGLLEGLTIRINKVLRNILRHVHPDRGREGDPDFTVRLNQIRGLDDDDPRKYLGAAVALHDALEMGFTLAQLGLNAQDAARLMEALAGLKDLEELRARIHEQLSTFAVSVGGRQATMRDLETIEKQSKQLLEDACDCLKVVLKEVDAFREHWRADYDELKQQVAGQFGSDVLP
jgi:hypothetical protein